MEKSVTLVSYIYKACVETRHELLHLCDVNVSNRVRYCPRLALVFHQSLVFEKSYGHVFLLNVYNDFACHFSFSFIVLNDDGLSDCLCSMAVSDK